MEGEVGEKHKTKLERECRGREVKVGSDRDRERGVIHF